MRRVGIRDVAARAGVSISTVSNALNKPHSVSPSLRERVRAAVDELGYVPLPAARQLRAGRSGLLGMAVINIANPFFGELVSGAEEAAAAAGMRVLVGNSEDDLAKERDHLQLFERVQVEGVLISPFRAGAEWIARLADRGTPVVLVDGEDPEHLLSSVSFDDVAGGRLAAEHLISAGRRRLVFLGAREEVRQVRDRMSGVRAAVAAAPGVALEEVRRSRTTPEIGQRWGALCAGLPEEQRPDAVIAANDLLACGAVAGLVAHGVRVPDDVAVIGYDDIDFARIAAVPVSSVHQPARAMGRRAAEILIDQLAGAEARRTVVFTPELALRASTGG